MNTEFQEIFLKMRTVLGKYRLTFRHESELQEQIADILGREQIGFVREFKLSKLDRLDFLLGRVALEVKILGSINEHLRQIKRYNAHPEIDGTILLATRPFPVPDTLSGKPVRCINLAGNRL